MENHKEINSWEELKAELHNDYPNLTREQLAEDIAKEGEILKRLQKRVGKNKQEMQDWLSILG